MTRVLTVLLAAYSYLLVKQSAPKLAEQFANQTSPGNWASASALASSLWVLLSVQVVVCGLFLATPYLMRMFPEQIHIGVCRLGDYSAAQLARILPLLSAMSGWMAAWMGLVFVLLIREVIRALGTRRHPLPLLWLVGLSLAGIGAILFYFQARIDSAAEEAISEVSPR